MKKQLSMEDALVWEKGAMVGHPGEQQFSNLAACGNNPRNFKKNLDAHVSPHPD